MTRIGTRFVPVSALRSVLFEGKPIAESFQGRHAEEASGHELRKDKLRELFQRGAGAVAKAAGPVVVVVGKLSGKMHVDQGRHRIEVARELGPKQRILVRFVRGRM